MAEELSKELTDKDKILIVRGKQGKNFIEDKFSDMSVEFDKEGLRGGRTEGETCCRGV